MSEIAKPSKVNAVKAHFKRNQKRYIFGAGLAAGIVVTGYVVKQFGTIAPVIGLGEKAEYVMPDTPIKIRVAADNVAAFNRVVERAAHGDAAKIGKTLYVGKLPKEDLAKYNWLVLLINDWVNDYVAAHPEMTGKSFTVKPLVKLANNEVI